MNTAVIQQIQEVEGDEYQLLFQNVVTVHGVVLVGLNATRQQIQSGDIRVGDTVNIGKNENGLFVDAVNIGNRAPTSSPFFPPEPPPTPDVIGVKIGPVNLKDSQTDVAKTILLTLRGVLNNAGLTNVPISVGKMPGDSTEASRLAEVIDVTATDPA